MYQQILPLWLLEVKDDAIKSTVCVCESMSCFAHVIFINCSNFTKGMEWAHSSHIRCRWTTFVTESHTLFYRLDRCRKKFSTGKSCTFNIEYWRYSIFVDSFFIDSEVIIGNFTDFKAVMLMKIYSRNCLIFLISRWITRWLKNCLKTRH